MRWRRTRGKLIAAVVLLAIAAIGDAIWWRARDPRAPSPAAELGGAAGPGDAGRGDAR